MALAAVTMIAGASAQEWVSGPATATSHYVGTSILLQNGKVLIIGGKDESGVSKECELYDPLTNRITPAGAMSLQRFWYSSVMLRNGKVLAIGGKDNSGVYHAECELYDPSTNSWTPTGKMSVARGRATATLLNDGRVLVAGGYNNSTLNACEIYDPSTGTWSPAAPMHAGRNCQASVLLADGKVLTVSGYEYEMTSEVYDPAHNTWTLKGNIVALFPTGEHSLTLLRDGRALMAGGWGGGLGMTGRCELYNPVTGQWSTTAPLQTPRCGQRMVVLPDGRVMAIGGHNAQKPDDQTCFSISSCEIYDPATDKWGTGPTIPVPITYFVATLLPSGKIFISGGGFRNYTKSPETFYKVSFLLDPSIGTVTPAATMSGGGYMPGATLLPNGRVLVTGGSTDCETASSDQSMLYDFAGRSWTSAGTMEQKRNAHTASLLPSGNVLVVGGFSDNQPVATTEIYNYITSSWSKGAPLSTPRSLHTATQVGSGAIVVTGGVSSNGVSGPSGITNKTEIYDAAANAWKTGSDLVAARCAHTATLLPNGQILVAGGFGPSPLATCELYDPRCDVWTPAASMQTARAFHSATLLGDGTVLVAGGEDGSRRLSSCEIYDYRTNTWTSASSLVAPRSRHTATSMPNGDVAVAGGLDNQGHSLGDVETYSLSGQSWKTRALLTTPRSSHAATLLPNGSVMLIGGISKESACQLPLQPDMFTPSLGINDANRPVIASVSSTHFDIVNSGSIGLDIAGSGFRDDQSRGTDEASTGDYASSATNYPVVRIRRIGGDRYDNDFTAYLPFDAGSSRWSSSETHVRIPAGTPGNRPLPSGWYALTATANGVTSLPTYISISYPDEPAIGGPSVTRTEGKCTIRSYDITNPCMIQNVELDNAASSNVRIDLSQAPPALSTRMVATLLDPAKPGRVVVRVNGRPIIDDNIAPNGLSTADSLTLFSALAPRCDSVMLWNSAGTPLTIQSAHLLHGDNGFTIAPAQFPMQIPPHGSGAIHLCFTPGSEQGSSDTLVIENPCSDRLVPLRATVEGVAGVEVDENIHLATRKLSIGKAIIEAYPPVTDGTTITMRVEQFAPSERGLVELRGSVYSPLGSFVADAEYSQGALRGVGNGVVREGLLKLDIGGWPQGAYIIALRTKDGTIGYPVNIVR